MSRKLTPRETRIRDGIIVKLYRDNRNLSEISKEIENVGLPYVGPKTVWRRLTLMRKNGVDLSFNRVFDPVIGKENQDAKD